MEQTLELVRQMRPQGKWGYYAYPFCYNYTPKNMAPTCPVQVMKENNQQIEVRVLVRYTTLSWDHPYIYTVSNSQVCSVLGSQPVNPGVDQQVRCSYGAGTSGGVPWVS
uniref:Hyaluronidase n=1 Tax=Timema monikensis TaxID=170555 RepID=A0A7R9HU51_9NEOP|nr:unnamed protein product [Timema monikensis]